MNHKSAWNLETHVCEIRTHENKTEKSLEIEASLPKNQKNEWNSLMQCSLKRMYTRFVPMKSEKNHCVRQSHCVGIKKLHAIREKVTKIHLKWSFSSLPLSLLTTALWTFLYDNVTFLYHNSCKSRNYTLKVKLKPGTKSIILSAYFLFTWRLKDL